MVALLTSLLSIVLDVLPTPWIKLADSEGGLEAIQQMHDKIYLAAWGLFGFLAIVGGGLVVSGLIAKVEIDPKELILRMVLVACLLVGFEFMFYGVLGIGLQVSYEIMTQEDQDSVSKSINESVPKDDGETGTTTYGWLVGAVTFITNFTLDPGVGLVGMIIALADILFFISLIFMGLLWLALVIVHFVFGPIVIALGVVPRWGNRFLSSWTGSLIQLAMWPVWFAFVTWFITITNKVFIVTNASSVGDSDTKAQNLESASLALIFAVMNFSAPFIINILFPLSRTSQMGQYAYSMAMNKVGGMGSSFTRTAGAAVGAAAGGPGGAAVGASAGGAMSDGTQKIVNPVGGGGGGSQAAAAGGGGGGGGGATGRA